MSPRAGNREKKTCVKGLSQNWGAPLPLPTAPLSSLGGMAQLSSGARPVRRKTEQPLPFLGSLGAQLLPVDLRRHRALSAAVPALTFPPWFRPPTAEAACLHLGGPQKGREGSLFIPWTPLFLVFPEADFWKAQVHQSTFSYPQDTRGRAGPVLTGL